jgi:hypothetical protein
MQDIEQENRILGLELKNGFRRTRWHMAMGGPVAGFGDELAECRGMGLPAGKAAA